jgi:predicted GIY-YIG superfamily endonuclease
MNDYWVYILTNLPRRTVLYIGVTNSLEVRLAQHRRGEVRGFAWQNNAFALVYYEQSPEPLMAIAREKQLKGWVRRKKEVLISKMNPQWRDLAEDLFGENAHDADVYRNKRAPSTPPLRGCAQDDPAIRCHPERSSTQLKEPVELPLTPQRDN